MRIINLRLLHNDLYKKNFPLSNPSIIDSIVQDGLRQTLLPYHDKFLSIGWLSEPTENQLTNLTKLLSEHLDIEIGTDKLQQVGTGFPPKREHNQIKTVEEPEYKFDQGVSENIVPVLTYAHSQGISLKPPLSHNGQIVMDWSVQGNAAAIDAVAIALAKDPALSDVNNMKVMVSCSSSSSSFTIQNIAEWLLVKSLQSTPEEALKNLNFHLLNPTITSQTVVTIDGFNIRQVTPLIENVDIVPISDIEKMPIWQRMFPPNFHPSNNDSQRRSTAALVHTQSRHMFWKSDVFQRNKSEFNLYELISLLTLFGTSGAAPHIHFSQEINHPFPTGGYGSSTNIIESTHFSHPFSPDLKEFSDIYKKFKTLPEPVKNRINIALQRLNRCIRKSDLTDKTLELGIALESILLSGKDDDGSSGEITFRLSCRGAWLLGNSPESRSKIFNTLKAVYKLRSKAAHEGSVPQLTKKVQPASPPVHTEYLIQDGSKLCAEAILKVIKNESIPDWTSVVLGGTIFADK